MDGQQEKDATSTLLDTVGKDAPKAEEDPMKALMDAMNKDGNKGKN